MRTPRPLVAALLAFLLLAPTLHAKERVTQPFLGVKVREITYDKPRKLIISVVEIDLKNPDISFLVTPSNGDPNGDEPGDPNNETTRETTLKFMTEQKAQVAINATFFNMDGIDTDNIGLVVSKGELISPFRGDWPSINIDPDNNATILHGEDNTFNVTDPKSDKVKLYNAVTGSDQIVTDGKPIKPDDRSFFTTNHPRSAIGITKKHKLLLVTVDGRQEGFSEGIPLDELGKLMIKLGAVQALNLDGGGSTTLTIADPEPRVLNYPSSRAHDVNRAILRQVGTSLAVFAKPNPDYVKPEQREQPPQPKEDDKEGDKH